MNLGRRTSLSNPGLSVTPEYDHGKTLKKGILLNHSWSTHEPLIKGALGIQIHSCIHTFRMKIAIFGILRIPTDSFGLLRISRWTFWRIPDPWLSWMICLSITDLRGLFKDVHQSKFFVAPSHEKLMTPSTTHEWAELLNTHRQIKMMTPTAR